MTHEPQPDLGTIAATSTQGQAKGSAASGDRSPGHRGSAGVIVTASLVIGLVTAVLLAAVPFISPTESAVTGAVLCGFAIGWASLYVLTGRFTDQPQRWAGVAALFMGVGGLLLLAFGSLMGTALSWVWPLVLLALVVWIVIQVHRGMRSRAGRVQLYSVLVILGLCAVGGGWQTVRTASQTNPYSATGQLVDVGGYALHLECSGSGSPTVVLEPGAGGTSASMAWVVPAVAEQTRVCVYDRAGRGGSEPADRPDDGAQVAADLHTLLQKAGVPGPYILAGHSFGGLYVRIFAARYPEEVAGLVLIDSTASAEPAKSVIPPERDENAYNGIGRLSVVGSLAARVGLGRLFGDLVGGTLPEQSEEKLRYDSAQPNTVRSVVEEYLQAAASAREAAALRDFGDKPLYVLTAGAGHDDSWMTDQNRSASLSTNSAHDVIDGAAHQALEDDPQYAVHISRAVLAVLTSARSGDPLTDHA